MLIDKDKPANRAQTAFQPEARRSMASVQEGCLHLSEQTLVQC